MKKIKYNSNVSIKEFFWIGIFALIICLLCVFFSLKSFMQIQNYITVESKIIDKYRTSSMQHNESDATFIKVAYEYEGEIYNAEKRITFFSKKDIGDKINILINPDVPSQIDDSYYRYLTVFMSIFSGCFMIVTFNGYKIRKKEITEYEKRKML